MNYTVLGQLSLCGLQAEDWPGGGVGTAARAGTCVRAYCRNISSIIAIIALKLGLACYYVLMLLMLYYERSQLSLIGDMHRSEDLT